MGTEVVRERWKDDRDMVKHKRTFFVALLLELKIQHK